MIRLFYPKAVKKLIKRYKAVSPSGTVKYNPSRFAPIEIYSRYDEIVTVLEVWEFRKKIELKETKNG